MKAAAVDFYYQSIRLVPANVLWGVTLLALLALAIGGGPLVPLVAAPLLAIPYVGVARLAALTVRGRDVVLSDVWRTYREFGLVALGIGAVVTVATVLLASNVVIGATQGSFVGWAFATLAGSGLLAIWVLSFPLWLLLVDPERSEQRRRDRLRLAVLLVLAAPGRTALLAFVLALLLAVSTVAFAALLTISVAYANLVAARYLLPLADRLETWLAERAAGSAGRA
ncbi:MAG TPA: hypothetical protein VFO78_12415 [Candidatus Limnocylindrales bacterium]|nr:hypothetical protein [Candidatus Limnocylindrales bacterium]